MTAWRDRVSAESGRMAEVAGKTMNVLRQVLKWLSAVVVLPVMVMTVLMLWDNWQLQRELKQVAASFIVGGSPFFIALPEQRFSVVTVENRTTALNCATLVIKNGIVRSARIHNKPVAIDFQRGIDLRDVAAVLSSCDTLRIVLLAHQSFLKGELMVTYSQSAITSIATPRIWD